MTANYAPDYDSPGDCYKEELDIIANRTSKILSLLLAALIIGYAVSGSGAAYGAEAPIYDAAAPVFSIPAKGSAIYIDLDICKMTVYKEGKVFKIFPVSGGKPSTPSPLGLWKIAKIESWGQWYGGCFMRLNVPWGTYGIHGTVTPHVIGNYNASGGCIRMHNKDVHELKRYVGAGTPVYIKQKTAAFRVLELGMIGSDVYNTQQMLKAMGYYKGSVDGKYGNGFEKAVKDFQKRNKLKPDGIIRYDTYKKIRESLE